VALRSDRDGRMFAGETRVFRVTFGRWPSQPPLGRLTCSAPLRPEVWSDSQSPVTSSLFADLTRCGIRE